MPPRGQQLWKFDGFNDEAQLAKFFLCCGRNNHGVAFGDGKVFVGRFDDSVVALNADTGKPVWQSTVADFHDRVAINSAPQFVDAGGRELVVISLSGGEFEIRGQVFALDAKTGKTVWHFSTTQPTSFAGQSFLTGGGAVWKPAGHRCGARARVPQRGKCRPRHSRREPGWRQSIFRIGRCGRPIFRQSGVAFPGSAPRHWDYDSAQPAVLFPLEKGGKHFRALGHCAKTGSTSFSTAARAIPFFR